MNADPELEAIADRLATIGEDLDQLAFDRLRLASEEGATERPAGDKELVQARRAVEKAVTILRTLTDD